MLAYEQRYVEYLVEKERFSELAAFLEECRMLECHAKELLAFRLADDYPGKDLSGKKVIGRHFTANKLGIEGFNFRNADCRRSSFDIVSIRNCIFDGADLRGAFLGLKSSFPWLSDFTGTTFHGALIDECYFHERHDGFCIAGALVTEDSYDRTKYKLAHDCGIVRCSQADVDELRVSGKIASPQVVEQSIVEKIDRQQLVESKDVQGCELVCSGTKEKFRLRIGSFVITFMYERSVR